jgi:glycosyltransferase involved in cell wall biosynthesis
MGGGGSHAYYLAHALSLSDKNIKVHVLTSSDKNEAINDPSPYKNLTIHRTKFVHTDLLFYDGVINKGLELCEKIKPDIIHGQHLVGVHIGLHLKAAFNKPLVVTLHKTPLLIWEPSEIKSNAQYCNIKLLTKLDIIDVFVAGSSAFKNELLEFGVREEKIEQIYHGIPLGWFKKKAYDQKNISSVIKKIGLKDDDNLIICPCRLDERKKIELFVKASGLLQKKVSNKKFIFLITGNAKNQEEQKYKNELIEIAKSYGIEDYIKFQSFEFDEIPALNQIAKVCVLPSISEGLGLVLIEALAVQTPIIGTNTKGINEVISENRLHGLRFKLDSYEQLSECLIELLTDDELYKKLKTNGFKRVKAIFDSKLMAQKHLFLYNKLLNDK